MNKTSKKTKIPLESKKEAAKVGMIASLGIVTATSFIMRNRLAAKAHIGLDVALICFSIWHHFLYQKPKNP
ncbi:MAG: hypothetical protein LBP89_07830 [Helicobacteraceae bacterium]|nr:hypothetical protein [Helicobacteraceae bacterium]